MGKPTGFIEYERKEKDACEPLSRIQNFQEFHLELSQEERSRQASRCMDCGVPFCQSGMMIGGMVSGCPLHNLIPEWNDLLYTGNLDQSYERLHKTNNFPEFTSRVCPALCEAACTCNLNGKPVTSKDNEYTIIEHAFANGLVNQKKPMVGTGKKIVIVGSGPSGLAAADQLNQRGHQVTVLEREDRLGGLLMYGIPNMKLEKWVIDRRIAVMKKQGIVFRTGVNVGKDISAKQLMREYDAVILACGASKPRDLVAKGREKVVSSVAQNYGVFFAVDFLKRVTKHVLDDTFTDYIDSKDKNVIVVGGGDTGNDCVGTCIRQGAKSVLQLEMMPKLPAERDAHNPWPQWPRICKTDYGQEEAIAVYGQDPRVYQTTIKEFITDNKGRLTKVCTVQLSKTVDKSTGRLKMKEIPNSEKLLDADLVLIAAGFTGAEDYVLDAFDVNEPSVYVTGDMKRGQSLVVWAIAEGRSIAKEVDQKLMGYTNL